MARTTTSPIRRSTGSWRIGCWGTKRVVMIFLVVATLWMVASRSSDIARVSKADEQRARRKSSTRYNDDYRAMQDAIVLGHVGARTSSNVLNSIPVALEEGKDEVAKSNLMGGVAEKGGKVRKSFKGTRTKAAKEDEETQGQKDQVRSVVQNDATTTATDAASAEPEFRDAEDEDVLREDGVEPRDEVAADGEGSAAKADGGSPFSMMFVIMFYILLRLCGSCSFRNLIDLMDDRGGVRGASAQSRSSSSGATGGFGAPFGSDDYRDPYQAPWIRNSNNAEDRRSSTTISTFPDRVWSTIRRLHFRLLVDQLNRVRAANGEGPISDETLRIVLTNRDFTGNDYEDLLRFQAEEVGLGDGRPPDPTPTGGASNRSQSPAARLGATIEEINEHCPCRSVDSEDYILFDLGEARADESKQVDLAKANASCCAVCLDPFSLGESVRTVNRCQHTFHAECIEPWLRRKAECPVCKCRVLPCPSRYQRQTSS